MKEIDTKTKCKFGEYELGIIINAQIELRNQIIREGRYTDAVDELFTDKTVQIVLERKMMGNTE